MVAVIGEAGVALRPESSKFAGEAERELSGKMGGIGAKAAGLFAAGFAAVAGAGAFFKSTIEQASDLSESASKVKVVFGDSAASVEEFASTASTSLGLSEAAALGAAGTFGNLLRSVGLTDKASADMSTSMIALAGDLASFNNVSPEEALDALRSGLVGETEPLKAFGVNMNEAALSAKAVELGLAATGETLDANAKAQAAYALIMEQTSLAQGDFARTSAGLANQQRIVRAQFLDLSANIGGLFVPMLGNAAAAITGGVMPALLRMTENLPELGETLGAVGDIFRLAFSDGLGPALDAYSELEGLARIVAVVAANVGDLSAVFREAFVNGATGSILLGATGLEGFAVTAGHVADQVLTAFVGAFRTISQSIDTGPLVQTFLGVVDQVRAAFGSLGGGGEGGGIASVFLSIGNAIGPALETIAPLISGYIQRWLDIFAAILPVIGDVITGLLPIFQDLFAQLGPVLQSLIPVVSQVAGVFGSTIVAVIEALAPIIPPLVAAIGQVASVLAGALLTVIQALAPVLPQLAEAFGAIALALAGALAGALGAIIPLLPPLLDAFLQLVTAALIPLLPLLPMLAGLVATLIEALAPLLPPIIELALVLVTLAVQAIVPLLPIVVQLIGMFLQVVEALMPIIQVGLQVVAFFLTLRTQVVSAVGGLVSGAINLLLSLVDWFISLPGRILSALGDLGSLLVGAGGDLIQGLVDGIAAAASFVGDVAGNIWRAIKDFVNTQLIDRLNGFLEFTIAGVTINPPDIPRLHSGGVFDSGSGEGLALLRDRERVVTPEQRIIADNLLADLLRGQLVAPSRGGAAAAPVQINQQITQLPGESGAVLAARVNQGTVWSLNHRITRRTGDAGVEPAR